jgi:hypothetical protein
MARDPLTADRTTDRVRAWRGWVLIGLVAAAHLLGSRSAGAQAWIYPSFQQPQVMNREFTVGVAASGYDGTNYIFQWREELAPRSQFIFDGGVATGVGGHSLAFVGGLYGYQLIQQRDSQAFEMLGTLGVGLAFGHGGTFTRVPVAVSLGHRFAFGNGVALTPYIHPEAALEFCNHCVAQVRGGTADAGVGAGFGLGANLELTPHFSVRVEGAVNTSTIGAQANTIGFGVAWSPAQLRGP